MLLSSQVRQLAALATAPCHHLTIHWPRHADVGAAAVMTSHHCKAAPPGQYHWCPLSYRITDAQAASLLAKLRPRHAVFSASSGWAAACAASGVNYSALRPHHIAPVPLVPRLVAATMDRQVRGGGGDNAYVGVGLVAPLTWVCGLMLAGAGSECRHGSW